jgi:hypothetical protein
VWLCSAQLVLYELFVVVPTLLESTVFGHACLEEEIIPQYDFSIYFPDKETQQLMIDAFIVNCD